MSKQATGFNQPEIDIDVLMGRKPIPTSSTQPQAPMAQNGSGSAIDMDVLMGRKPIPTAGGQPEPSESSEVGEIPNNPDVAFDVLLGPKIDLSPEAIRERSEVSSSPFAKGIRDAVGSVQAQGGYNPVLGKGAVDKAVQKTVSQPLNKNLADAVQGIIDHPDLRGYELNADNLDTYLKTEEEREAFEEALRERYGDSYASVSDLSTISRPMESGEEILRSVVFTRDGNNIEIPIGLAEDWVAQHNAEVKHNEDFREDPEYRNQWFLSNLGISEQTYRNEVAADLENRLKELRKKVVSTLPAQHTRGGYAAIGAAANKPSGLAPVSIEKAAIGAVAKQTSSLAPVSIEKIDKALKVVNTLRKNNFGAGLKEGFDLADILTLGVSGIGENVALLNALNKSASGKTLTTSEQALVEAWDIQNEAEEVIDTLGGRKRGAKVGYGVSQALGFMTQTAGTGGIASLATEGIGRAAARTALLRATNMGVNKSIKEGLRYGGLKVAESAVGAAARTPFMGFTYQNYTDKRLNQFQVKERVDEATGEISKYIDKREASALRDAAHAVLESYFENQSEDVGGLIDFGITSFARALPLKGLLRNRAAEALRGPVRNGAMKWIKEGVKLHSIIGETLSEAYGDAMVNLLTANNEGWKQMATSEYWWELGQVSSILSGGFWVANQGVNFYVYKDERKAINKNLEQRKQALSRIEDDNLKKELTQATLTDDVIDRSKRLSSLDWSNFSREDMANAVDFIDAQTRLDVMREGATESRRLARIMPAIDEVKKLADGGALDDEQAAASLATIYSDMFRTQENQRTLNILTDRIKVAADAGISADKINDILRNAGLTVFNPGDEIETLTGDRAIVDKVLPGAYEVVNNEGDRAVVSFEEVLQNTPEVRQIQQESNQTEGQPESVAENNPQVEQAVESARQEAEAIKNLDDDVIYEATLSDGTPVNIIKGANIVYNNQTGEVDYDASDATVVVRSNDGSKRQISIREIDSIDQAMSVDEALEVATAAATEVVNSQEQAETATAEVASTQAEVPSAQGAEAATVEQSSESPAYQPEEQPQIPLLKNGEPDYNAMDARMFAEQYVTRFGEGATERIARNNIKASNKTISTIEKQIEDVTDPNKMPALYSKLQDAQATKDKYSAVLEELGLSADESEDNTARIQRKKQENTPWFNKLFPDGFPNVESVILWDIANGSRIRWTNKEVNGAVVSKGLGSHLGLADSNAERTRRVALIGKDAPTPEEYAEQLPERLNAMGIRFEESELLDKVLDVYASVDTVRKAKEELEKISANIQAEQEGLDYEEEQMRRNYEREQEALRQEVQPEVGAEQTEQEQITNEEAQEEELSIEDEVPFMVSSEPTQAPTEAQKLATEAAITALEDAGVEVVNATPEMVEEALQRKDVQMQSVNQKFNEQLDSFTEENATSVVFDLGMPSPILLAGGVADKPIKLYGNKLLKKIRKHGLNLEELKGLPIAIANPIAIFDNYRRSGNRSVLTELKTKDGNILVSIEIGKGVDINFDMVKSVFGKDDNGVLNWINKGYLTFVDKEKALGYLYPSAPIAATANSQELDSATKVVENFENPNIVPANSFAVENPSLVGLHNISEEKLRKAFRLSGLANPSVAVIDSNSQKHTGYGDITLVLPSAMIAKKTGKNIGTYFGDAWTPTYPEVQKQLGNNRASQDIMELPDEMQNSIRLALNSWLDGRSGDSLSYMFLHQRGDAPEIHRTQAEFSPELHEAMTQITGGQDFYYLNDEDRNRVLDLYVQEKHDGSRDEFNAHMRRVIERGNRLIAERGENSLIGRKAKEAIDAINEYGYDYDSVSGFVRDVHRDMEYSGKVDPQYTLLLAERKVKENGLEGEFAQWLDSLEDRYAIKEVIFKGYTPSGNRRYIPNTLENASKEMRLQGRAGATGLSIGFSNFAARLLQPGVTLDGIRKRKHQLKTSIEEVDAFKDKWSSVMFDLGEKCQPNATGYEDYGLERLAEAATKNDPQAYLKSEYGVDLSDEDVKRLKDMVKAIRTEYPVMYFETKFERPVYFNEFAGAVVPDNASADVIQSLKDAGVPVWVYAASDENARMDAIKNIANSSNDIFFSIGPAPVFVSNAKIAVLGIKQEKATPEQWLKMIEKAGGLKAGEDKWIGLSDWLKASDKKTLTKQEVLDYINENQIQIEETTYSSNNAVETTPEFKALQEEFKQIAKGYEDEAQRNLDEYEAKLAKKYNFPENYFDTTVLNSDETKAHSSLSRAVGEAYNAAWVDLVDRYGDDFEIAFWRGNDGIRVDNAEAAGVLLGLPIDRPIYHIREDYTTKGLEGNREIALTVPTIEPWNANDEVHFGDAGEGRAIAWVRFGETTTPTDEAIAAKKAVEDYLASMREKYGSKEGEETDAMTADEIDHLQSLTAKEIESRERGLRVLVIDEIQSKRHQEGRERGYISGDIKAGRAAAKKRLREAYDAAQEYRETLKEKYNWDSIEASSFSEHVQKFTALLTPEEIAERERLDEEKRKADEEWDKYDRVTGAVPEAPFEKNWAELAMKRMLRYAAENGFDKVAWTKGDQQAERYGLRQTVEQIIVADNNIEELYDGTPIVKDAALIMQRGVDYNLKVDENGVIRSTSFSGKTLSDVVGKSLAERIMQQGDFVLKNEDLAIGGEGMRAFYDQMLPSFMRKYGKKWGVTVQDVTLPYVEEAGRTMHSVEVTESMRESVMQGQPMFYRRPNGTVYGWTNGTTVYLTESGMNPNTPIHEYTHIWADAMRKHNPEGWKSIVKLLKGTPVWSEVMADTNYANIHGDEHKVASEALSRISGRENAAKMEAMAQQMIDENANDTVKKNRARKLLDRMRKALQEFWSWVGKELFGIKNFESIEQVTDRILYDLVSGTDLNPVSSFDISAAERAEIIRASKASETYLKAPNGKDTNLTPEQWVTVRTKAFKRWFGDWEKAARIEKLRTSESASIVGNEIESSDDMKQYRKNALEYGKSLRGEYRNADTGRTIIINRDSLTEVLHHDGNNVAHIQSIAAIPQMVERGIFITSEPVYADASEKLKNAKEVQYYVCGLNIGGVPYTVKFVVAEYENGERYYDHSLTQIEKGDLLNRAELSSTVADSKSPISDIKDKRLVSILQTNSSKIVDANGEPLVVWHGGEFATDEFVANGSMHFGTKVAALQRILDNSWGYGNWTVGRNSEGRWSWKYTDPDDTGHDKRGETAFALPIEALVDAARIAAPKAVVRPYYLNIRNLERTMDQNTDWEDVISESKEDGHDGIVYRNDFEDDGEDSYIAFSPNQIKLADGSNMTFAPDNDDIRFRIEENVERTEKVASEAQKVADKFGLSNEIVVVETQEDYIREIKSEGIPDEYINPESNAVYMPSGRVIINAMTADDAAELSDSIMHEIAHSAIRGGDILYGLHDTVLEVGEERFEAAGREIFGQTTDPLVVADEIIANFVGSAANPSLFDGLNLAGEYVDGKLPFDQIYDLIIGVVTEELRVNYTDVLNAVKPYVKEVLDTIKTNHNGPKETRRVRVASRENREAQVDAINGSRSNADNQNVQTGDTSKTAPEQARDFRTTVQGSSGGQKTREDQSNDGSVLQGRGADSAEQIVRVGSDSLLEGVNEFSIGPAPVASESQGQTTSDQENTLTPQEDKAKDKTLKQLDRLNKVINSLRQTVKQAERDNVDLANIVQAALEEEVKDGGINRFLDVPELISLIRSGMDKKSIESTMDRLSERLTDAIIKNREEQLAKLLQVQVQGTNAFGIPIGYAVDDETRAMVEFFRENLSRDMKKIVETMENADEKFLQPYNKSELNVWFTAYKEIEESRYNIKATQKDIDHETERSQSFYRLTKELKAKNASESQIKTAQEHRRQALRNKKAQKKAILVAKQTLAQELEGMIFLLGGRLRDGRAIRAGRLSADKVYAKNFLTEAMADVRVNDGTKTYQGTKEQLEAKAKFHKDIRVRTSAYRSYAYMIQSISRNAIGGKGFLWDALMEGKNGWVDCNDKRLAMDNIDNQEILANVQASGLKSVADLQRLFDKQLVDKNGNPYIFRYETDRTGRIDQDIRPTIGWATYIVLCFEQDDMAPTMEKMRITEEQVQQIRDMLPEAAKEFLKWSREMLSDRRQRIYNPASLERFGTQMANIPNYFPIRRLEKNLHKVEEVEQVASADSDQVTIMANALIKRVRNVVEIDFQQNPLELLKKHLERMNGFAANVPLARNVNILLNSSGFRDQLNEQGDPNTYEYFKAAAKVALSSYKPKPGALDSVMIELQGWLAAGKIAWRFFTALKQLLSIPAFWTYNISPRYKVIFIRSVLWPAVKNGDEGKLVAMWKWGMDNIPQLKERWSSRYAGNEKLAQVKETLTAQFIAKHALLRKTVGRIGEWGMIPNAAVDLFACSIGCYAVYTFELEQLQKKGYSKEEADELAKRRASIAFNESQQSSEAAFIAPLQRDRTFLAVQVSLFNNSNFGYGRKEKLARKYLWQQTFNKDLREKQLALAKRRYLERFLNEERKRLEENNNKIADVAQRLRPEEIDRMVESKRAEFSKRAEKEANRDAKMAYAKGVEDVVMFKWLLNMAWQMAPTAVTYWLSCAIRQGDDEDPENPLSAETLALMFATATFRNAIGGGVLESALNGYGFTGLVGSEVEKTVDILAQALQPLWLTDEEAESFDPLAVWMAVKQCLVMGTGFDVNVYANIFTGLVGLFNDRSRTTADVLRILNAPKSMIREIEIIPFEDETLDNYTRRMAMMENVAMDRLEELKEKPSSELNAIERRELRKMKKWEKNLITIRQAEAADVPYGRGVDGRVVAPELKQLDADYTDLLKSLDLTQSGKNRAGKVELTEDERRRKKALRVVKRVKGIHTMEESAAEVINNPEAYRNAYRQIVEEKRKLIEEWNQ